MLGDGHGNSRGAVCFRQSSLDLPGVQEYQVAARQTEAITTLQTRFTGE